LIFLGDGLSSVPILFSISFSTVIIWSNKSMQGLHLQNPQLEEEGVQMHLSHFTTTQIHNWLFTN
jgi:hypothetical protein